MFCLQCFLSCNIVSHKQKIGTRSKAHIQRKRVGSRVRRQLQAFASVSEPASSTA